MLKFKSINSLLHRPACPVTPGEPLYLCIETYDGDILVDKAVVTADELRHYFGDTGYGINVTGYMSETEALKLTPEQRGLPILDMPTLLKPTTVPQDIWDTLDIRHKAWVIEHEKMHEKLNETLRQIAALATR